MPVEKKVSDDRAKSDIYNAGLSVKSKKTDAFDYLDAAFGNQEPTYIPGNLKRDMMAFHVPSVGT